MCYNTPVNIKGKGNNLNKAERFNLKGFIKENLFIMICALIAFVCVLSTAIVFKQNPIKTIPLFISITVMLLQTRVSRYAFLLGGMNAIIYTVAYLLMGLYATAAYAILISCPLQIITFINWNKKTSKGVTELRKMRWHVRGLIALGFLLIWPAAFFGISSIPGANQSVLDVTGTMLGILVTVLSMLRFSEYAPLNLVNITISLATHISIFTEDTSNITYVIYTVYSGICTIASITNIRKAKML